MEQAIKLDPVVSAERAGLEYVTDDEPGIRRKRVGRHFSYMGLDGQPIRDPAELKRLKSLAIPPAWTEVWICPNPNGHIQATARDAKGRKQYRYHPEWRAVRDETKFSRMARFALALPTLRERVEADLGRRGLPKEKVLAAVVRLLETTHIRVGNEEYAQHNDSYGLTTLRDEHAQIQRSKIVFEFRGKSGKEHSIDLRDRRLAGIVKRCQDLPGQRLFQYLGEDDECYSLVSNDVNAYLRDISGEDFTAKDFRTWAGTVLCAEALAEIGPANTKTEAKRLLVRAIDRVAEQLGNTRAVCRKSYIHPAIMDAYLDGSFFERWTAEGQPSVAGLSDTEVATLALLQPRP
ncbi:MAG: DNA topoisomerase IB [Anaerolineae bacterium]|nr:DNA topoisomerase IB [Anaerolineae bacterium]